MRRVKIFLLQLYLKSMLFIMIKYIKKENWRDNVAVIMLLTNTIPYFLLEQYSRKLGDEITINTGLRTAEGVLIWIRKARDIVSKDEYVNDSLKRCIIERSEITMTNFMVNVVDGVVRPEEFYSAINLELTSLYDLIEQQPEDFKQYYHRAFSGAYTDIFSILEGLHIAALNV